MKMRKALSFVLVLALVLGSFSMAFAASPITQGSDLSDIADSANYDAIVANSDLGIITGYEDGSFKPENNVNRAEFAAMITRMLGVPDSGLGGYSASAFSDMSGYGWASAYVGFCAAKGIVNGYGDGTFGPGNTITVNEAITMVARAVGYVNNSSELVGNWPANYVTLGKRLGLYDDVTSVATINRENAAQVIYNALTTVVVAVNADGDTNPAYTYRDDDNNLVGKTVLEVYLDCTATGWVIFTPNDASDSVINTMEYIGAYVKAFKNSDDEAVAIAEVKSTFLTGKYDDADGVFKAGGVKYNFDGAQTYVENKATKRAIQFTNVGAVSNTTGTMADDTTYTIAANVSGKTIKEVYSVATWTSVDAFQFEADMLEDDAINGYDFALDDNDAIDAKAYALLGVASLDKIAEDNVVRVYLKGNTSNGDIVRVTVGTETVEGKITLADDSDQEVTIGGKVYAVAANAEGFEADIEDNLGDTGTAYLDYDGDIAFWDVDDAASDNFAVVTGDYDKPGARDATVVLLDKEGNEKEYTVKSGTGVLLKQNTLGAYTTAAAADTDFTAGTLVTFALDKNGKISEITALTVNTVDRSGDDIELSASRTILGNDRVEAGIVVFAYDGSDYSVVSINDVKTKTELYDALAFDETPYTYKGDNGRVKVLIVDSVYTGAESVYAVLNSVGNTFNDDDDEVQVVKGFADGKDYTGYTDARTVVGAKGTIWGHASGTPIVTKLSVTSGDVITKAAPQAAPVSPLYDKGWVITKSNRDLGINDNATWDASLEADEYAAIDPNAVVYVINGDDKYELGNWSSIRATTSIAGSFVYLYQLDSDSEVYDLVIVDKGKTDAENAAMAAAIASLEDVIADAQSLHDGATEGIASGQYAVGSKATLQAAINAAQAVLDADPAATLAAIQAAEGTLETAVGTFEAGVV